MAELRSSVPVSRTRALGRLLSAVEDGDPQLPAAMAALVSPSEPPGAIGEVTVIGITGPPGAGKSTVTAALVAHHRRADRRVGVLAVDPTSPFSGGAVLGDRVRMQAHALDDGVFIRSVATRGHLGGVASSTPQAIRLLAVAGCAVVIVETVGVGQSEVDVARTADTTVVVLAPGMGDAVQAAKAGILEVADVYLVNKADRPGASDLRGDLRGMLALVRRQPGDWRPPVASGVALDDGGLVELLSALDAHAGWLASSRTGQDRRVARARAEIESIALVGLYRQLRTGDGDGRLLALAADVAAGRTDAYSAAARWTASGTPNAAASPWATGAPLASVQA